MLELIKYLPFGWLEISTQFWQCIISWGCGIFASKHIIETALFDWMVLWKIIAWSYFLTFDFHKTWLLVSDTLFKPPSVKKSHSFVNYLKIFCICFDWKKWMKRLEEPIKTHFWIFSAKKRKNLCVSMQKMTSLIHKNCVNFNKPWLDVLDYTSTQTLLLCINNPFKKKWFSFGI